MFNYEKRLVEASLEPLALRDPTRSPRRVTVDWLRKESPQIDWLNTLQSVYPEANVNMDTEILLPDDKYIVELSKIISSTGKSSMNAYLMWRLIAGYYPYLPEHDRAVLDVLRSELTGVKQPPPHWLTCTRMTREFFPLAAGALLARDEPVEARELSQRAAEDLFRALTQSLGSVLTYSRFISEESRASVIQKVTSLDLVAGYPPLLLEDKLLDRLYSDLAVLRYGFFESVQAARRHQRVVQQKAYLAPGQQWELEPLLNGASVSYSSARNAVVVPDQLMRPPLFDPAYPPPFQYGGLGTRLADAILSSIDHSSLTSSMDRSNATTTDHETMAHNQETFRACVSAALAAAGVQQATVARVSASASVQVLAVRLALETLKDHLEEVGDKQLPGLEAMEAEKVFFIAYGQSQCRHKTEEKDHWDEFTKFSLDGKIKLDLAVEQAAAFRDVFHCNATHAHVIAGPCGGFV
ncbi:neprilysin-11-like [Pollicipes pollicipes]|uniref:neprilysin-11-like n=1 Tax=Pollicipes pollicipes TaxID=41117 RepID=UPI001884BE4F|nr:neprilysin-11-like [Pollicipes pollicipes]